MEDIQFHGGHAVERAFENVDWHEVASAVDHESAPAETWRVVNRYGGNENSRLHRTGRAVPELRARAWLRPQ